MLLKAVHPACVPFSLVFSIYLSAQDLNSGHTHFPTPGLCMGGGLFDKLRLHVCGLSQKWVYGRN